MNLEQLANIHEQAKKLKCAVIVVCGNNILGTDEQMATFTNMIINNELNVQLAYDSSEMDKILAQKDVLIEAMKEHQEIPDDLEYFEIDGVRRYIRVPFFFANVMKSNANLQQLMLKPPDVLIDNVREDPNFEAIGSYKASDGVYFYRTNGYTLSIYKSLLSITKNDKIKLEIYNHGSKFLAKFIVEKNKKITINHYVLYGNI